jgi:hypothetical protein
MRKLGLGLVGIIAAATIYYFTSGSDLVINEIKDQLNQTLTTLQKNGFTIEERESSETKEHFILTLSSPIKVASYFKDKGLQINRKDLSSLKGLKVAVDAKYFNDIYSALSIDLYPKALPSGIQKILEKEDTKLLTHIEKLITDKSLLLHIDFNKLFNGFKGNIKNINEVFEDEIALKFLLKGVTFEGSLKDKKITKLQQNISLFSLQADSAVEISLTDFSTTYARTGSSRYDTEVAHKLENFKVYIANRFHIDCSQIEGHTSTQLQDKLLKSSVHSNIEKIILKKAKKSYYFTKNSLDFTLSHFNIEAFKKLQATDPEDHLSIKTLSKQIFSKGIELHLENFSSEELDFEGTSMKGFQLNTYGKIDTSFDLKAAQEDPLLILKSLQSKTHIEVSNHLFAYLLMQDSRIMMMQTIFPPEEKNEKKIYDLSYLKGKLTVNGMDF